ncbi:hypothetical protein B0T20DRAFT_398866 [Sordaria brevicollis]|uniref:DUF1772-domain-containing protein n=1 Tax=Sordaria brevicollis TaxID=83679 RepID=A0AAE0PMD1_SORBR|nr:hypothetical protein B0T20DRAFT_398866 [Sordaria brevicollis]
MSALTGAQLGLMTGSFLSGCLLSIPLLTIPTLTSPQVLTPDHLISSGGSGSNGAPLLLSSWSTLYHLGSLTMPPLAALTASLYSWSAYRLRYTTRSTPIPFTSTSTSTSPSTLTSPSTSPFTRPSNRTNGGKQKRIATWKLIATAAGLTLSIIPFTLLVMAPTNEELKRLNEMQIEPGPLVSSLREVMELVERWNWLHIVRSMGPVLGCVVGWFGVFGGDDR